MRFAEDVNVDRGKLVSSYLCIPLLMNVCTYLIMHYCYSPGMLMVGTVMSLGLIIALMVKRKETPTNFYLLGAFVSINNSNRQ